MKKPVKKIPVVITREDDDSLAEVRISMGKLRGEEGFYFVFRGEPEATVELLTTALAVAKHVLPAGMYADKRGRPQG